MVSVLVQGTRDNTDKGDISRFRAGCARQQLNTAFLCSGRWELPTLGKDWE